MFRCYLNRRCLLASVALILIVTLGFGWAAERAHAQIPGGTLDPLSIPKYMSPLIIPPAMEPVGESGAFTEYEIAVRQFPQQVLPAGLPFTTVWGYGNPNIPGSFNFPAFTVEARRNEPIRVTWINDLVAPNGDCLPHLLPVDQTLHWANPPGGEAGRDKRGTSTAFYEGPVPMVTHVHGARVPGTSDGYPEAWWLPDCNVPSGYAETGTTYFSEQSEMTAPGTAVFEYPNDQRATTLWYHDHALGITRLNVYAGMAGFWLLRDAEEDSLNLPGPAPQVGDAPGTNYYEIPIVIQDRSFNADGSFFYPDTRAFFEGVPPNPDNYYPNTDVSPIWNPEFFGNTMVVNGRTWPYLEVEPRVYRLRFLNGTNSRFLILKMDQETTFHQIGTEGGLLPGAPLPLPQLLMAPAERADVLVDFSKFAPGTELTLLNIGPDEPYGGGEPGVDFDSADPDSTGQVMQFRVVAPGGKNKVKNKDKMPPTLPPIDPLGAPVASRDLTLNEEVSDFEDIPIAAFLGTQDEGPLGWGDAITESPMLGDTEVWNIINLTEDAHPIHLHLVMFQVVDRIVINAEAYAEAQELYLQGYLPNPPNWEDFQFPNSYPPEPWESGWKDTVIAYPGEVTRIKARFDLPGLYVWHCHILEHEDNEMMRPYEVLLNDAVPVSIDIMPEDPFNFFDCNDSNGVIPVAILGSASFDVTTVDHASVRFEGAWETHLDSKSQRMRHMEMDVNGDGILDLVLHFRLNETTLTCDSTEASLIAYTYDGNVIYGTDMLVSVGPAITCAADYWVQNGSLWQTYTPFTPLSDVFTALPPEYNDLNGDGWGDTFVDALLYDDATPLQSVLREAVAGILAAESPDIRYPLTSAEIVDVVTTTLNGGNLQGLADELSLYNERWCKKTQ